MQPWWSGMGEVVPARTSPTLHPPIPSHCASIVTTSTLRVNSFADYLNTKHTICNIYLGFSHLSVISNLFHYSKCICYNDLTSSHVMRHPDVTHLRGFILLSKSCTVESHTQIEALFLYCCPDCLCCPANAIQMGQTTWAIWAAIRKYSLSGHTIFGRIWD